MITVAIPAYNEEENIKRIEPELLPVLEKLKLAYEVIIIDDGSDDKTAEYAFNLTKKYEQIRLVKHSKNMGLGAAIKTAIGNAWGEVFIPLDSDFTFHPREMPKLVTRFNEGDVDCVIGSHFGKSGKTENIPFHRLFLSKTVNILYSFLLGKKLSSISSIFRLYKTHQLKELNLVSNDFDINAEILFHLIKRERKIVEVPVTLSTRICGESKLDNKREIRNHLRLFKKILLWRVRTLIQEISKIEN